MKNYFKLLILLFVFCACENDDIFNDNNDLEIDTELNSNLKSLGDDKYTILGAKKTIPCSVTNMTNALNSISSNPTAKKHPDNNYSIDLTHYYIKFSPQDSIQYDIIVNDSVLSVSDVPFEYDIVQEGSVYLDPNARDTIFLDYYSVVPKDYIIPSEVPHEIIDNLHFTNEDSFGEELSEREENILEFYEDLNTEALKLSDNLERDEKENHTYFISNPNDQLSYADVINLGLEVKDVNINYDLEFQEKLFGSRWRPSGNVTVEEDAATNVTQAIGVQGARIRVRKWGWLVIRQTNTNEDGYFQTSRTRTRRVKYTCIFKNRIGPSTNRFVVKAGTWFWNARDKSHETHTKRAWNRHYTGGRNQFYAFVQNASYDYYQRWATLYNITRPKTGISISANWNTCNSSQTRLAFFAELGISRIRITRRRSNCNYRGSDGIYASTIHELTHVAHREMDPGMFSLFHAGSCNRAVLTESWAEGVETLITNHRYAELTFIPGGFTYQSTNPDDLGGLWNSWRQRRSANQMNEYTPIVADLRDELNQNAVSTAWPLDRVENYYLYQIEHALDNCRNIQCWENNLRIYYWNATEYRLAELFTYVYTVRNNLSSPCY